VASEDCGHINRNDFQPIAMSVRGTLKNLDMLPRPLVLGGALSLSK
jgi:hypothetical protein